VGRFRAALVFQRRTALVFQRRKVGKNKSGVKTPHSKGFFVDPFQATA
jgi:hypothetical protein